LCEFFILVPNIAHQSLLLTFSKKKLTLYLIFQVLT